MKTIKTLFTIAAVAFVGLIIGWEFLQDRADDYHADDDQ